MTFTYDLTLTGNDLVVSQIRIEVGDSVLNKGPRPEQGNFTDAELLYFYQDEGNNRTATVARVLEVLSREWAHVANTAMGPLSIQYGRISENFAARARTLRTQAGPRNHVGSVGTIRVDGYSDDIASDEVD